MAPGMHSPAVRPSPGSFWDMHLQSASPSAGGSGTPEGRLARHARRLCTPPSGLSGRRLITTLLSPGSFNAAPTGPLSRGPTCRPHHLEPLETLLGCPLYVMLSPRRWVTPAQALSTGFSVTLRSLQGPLQNGLLSITGVTCMHVGSHMHGCLRGAWRHTQARLMPTQIPPQRPPSLDTHAAPRGLHLPEPPHPLSVRGHVRKGKALGAPSQWQTL